jgi:hypothetical protein
MTRPFEFDPNRCVLAELSNDPGVYIADRIQEINSPKFASIINYSAELAIPGLDSDTRKLQITAYFAGAAVALEAFEHTDLGSFQREYMRRRFICSRLPKELRELDAELIREHIEFSALIGHVSHPELIDMTEIMIKYYADVLDNPAKSNPVQLGVGHTAFILDKCFLATRLNDPKFDIAQTLEETDWDRIMPDMFFPGAE